MAELLPKTTVVPAEWSGQDRAVASSPATPVTADESTHRATDARQKSGQSSEGNKDCTAADVALVAVAFVFGLGD